MEYRTLGRTGLKVSVLSYGVYSLTGMYGYVDESEAIKVLTRAWDLGINFYDTADVYGFGLGERLLKKAFGDGVRDLVIATKVGYDFYLKPMVRRYDPNYIKYAVSMSIERLGKKPIDLLQIHNPPHEVLRRESLYRTLRELIEEGLVQHVGIALGPEVNVLKEALEALAHEEVEAIQFVYNMLEQQPGRIIASMAKRFNVGVIVRVPHAGGVLDESLKPGMESMLEDHRSLRRSGWFKWAYETYGLLKQLLKDLPGTPGQKALRFIMDTIEPHSVVLIAKDIEKLVEYLGALKLPRLNARLIEELERVHDDMVRYNPELQTSTL